MASSPATPAFTLKGDRYDQTTFWGRLQRIVDLFNPMQLLASESDIEAAQRLLSEYEAKGPEGCGATDEELWQARELVEARVHPDTGKPVPVLLCFAAYAPMQPPIILGLMWPNASTASALFWQWYNQSYNVAVNYANRNEAGTLTNTQLGMAYGAGVSTAMGATYGFAKLTEKMAKKYPRGAPMVKMLIPFISIVAAGTVSLVVVRQGELVNGVAVSDKDGNVYGESRVAAQTGITQCAIARVLWNIPVLIMPPVVMNALKRTAWMKRNPRAELPAITAICTFAVVLGVYPAQAVFPQRASIAATSLEPRFHNRRHPTTGELVQTYWFNKGL